MVRLNGKLLLIGVLWGALLASALAVVYVTFDVRRKTQTLANLGDQTQALQVETGQLLLEESALAAYARVEKIATEKLGMRVPTGHEIVVVRRP
jgi:cell division protein FtsL